MTEISRRTKRYPSDLTDVEWARIAELLPKPATRGRKRRTEMREIINALLYLVRSGCGWEMLPVHFGPWQTIYWWFRRLMRRFLFRTLHDLNVMLDRERVGREASPSGGVMDSQSVTGPSAKTRGYDAAGRLVKQGWQVGSGVSYNVITGTTGSDTLTGTSGNDDISALAGGDTINAGGGKDRIWDLASEDRIDVSAFFPNGEAGTSGTAALAGGFVGFRSPCCSRPGSVFWLDADGSAGPGASVDLAQVDTFTAAQASAAAALVLVTESLRNTLLKTG